MPKVPNRIKVNGHMYVKAVTDNNPFYAAIYNVRGRADQLQRALFTLEEHATVNPDTVGDPQFEDSREVLKLLFEVGDVLNELTTSFRDLNSTARKMGTMSIR